MDDERLGCGDHDLDRNGNPFDYTCDDCMIPDSLDPPELNDLPAPPDPVDPEPF